MSYWFLSSLTKNNSKIYYFSSKKFLIWLSTYNLYEFTIYTTFKKIYHFFSKLHLSVYLSYYMLTIAFYSKYYSFFIIIYRKALSNPAATRGESSYINTQFHPKMFNFHTKLEITKFKDIST